MRFFEPSNKWMDWLVKYARGRIIFDVGCGEGHVVKGLRARGARTIGIDPLWDPCERDPDLCSAVIPGFAENCKLLQQSEDSLALFCRPCHNLFVERVLRVLPVSSEALYISLPSNLGRDFRLAEFGTTKVLCPKCPEEVVWRVSRRTEFSTPSLRRVRKSLKIP